MKIFQPIVSGSIFFPSLVTSSAAISNVIMQGTDGQLFITASSAIGGGGGPVNTSGLVTTSSFNNYTSSAGSTFAGTATTAVTASYAETLTIQGTLTDYYLKASTAPGINNIFTRTTGSYTSAFAKYTTYDGTNARAGEFITVWNGTTTTYYDNATTDIGDTSGIVFASSIVSNQIQINTGVSTPSGWTIKMLITYM